MKKTLLSILAAASLFNANAGPTELFNKVSENSHIVGYDHRMASSVGERQLKTNKDYNVTVKGYTHEYFISKPEKSKTLQFEITDKDTYLTLEDIGADGLNQGDQLHLFHKFKTGGDLFLDIKYLGTNNYDIRGLLRNPDLTLLGEFSVDTSSLSPTLKYLVKRKTKPLLKWGNQMYEDLVFAADKEQGVELPYQDIKKALYEVEKITPKLKEDSNAAEKALLSLSKEYLKLIKSKTR